MGNLLVTDLVTTEFLGSPIGTFGAVVGFIVVIFKLLGKMFRSLNSPIKGKAELFAGAGIPAWSLRLFVIGISLKKVPVNTMTDKFFTAILMMLSLVSVFFISYQFLYVRTIPENATLLIYKSTGENFYIDKTSAHGLSFFLNVNWSITSSECNANKERGLSTQDRLSSELAAYICEVFKNKESTKYLADEIEKFQKDRGYIYLLVSVLDPFLVWFTLSLGLNFYYRAVLSKYIRKQHELAMSYVM